MPPRSRKEDQPVVETPPGVEDSDAVEGVITEDGAVPLGDTVAVTEPGKAPGESDAVIEPEPGAVNQAVADLGETIRRNEDATGGHDLSEEAHLSAIDRMAQLGEGLELDEAGLVARTRDFLLEVIKARPKPWSATSAAEQRDVASACEQLAEGLVREMVEVIRSGGKPAVRVLLTKVTLGDDTQIVGKLKALAPEEEDEAVMMLHHARGKHVLLTVASVDDYKQEHRAARTDPEQPDFPFEAGSDQPDDNSDLVKAAEEPEEEESGEVFYRTGDERDGMTYRINLKEGMVQVLPEGSVDQDVNWVDEREATPAELAAERNRVADFEAEPA